MFVSVPKMMSDGQYLGRLSSRYISHSGKHVGHRLELDKFGKGRDNWRQRSEAQVGSEIEPHIKSFRAGYR
jgi:hypothetical protein